MISEVPVDAPSVRGQSPHQEIQEAEISHQESVEDNSTLEAQEATTLNPPPPPQPLERIPKKRGRPKKEPVPEAPEGRGQSPHPHPQPVPEPKKRPRAKPKPKPAVAQPIVEEASFSVNDLSNAQLIAELVNRQRATQREMKANLYRSFVM
jgi:hypothetical protein